MGWRALYVRALPTSQALTRTIRVRSHDQFEGRKISRGNVNQKSLPPDVQLKLPLRNDWTHLGARVAADEPAGMSRTLCAGVLTRSFRIRLADPSSARWRHYASSRSGIMLDPFPSSLYRFR